MTSYFASGSRRRLALVNGVRHETSVDLYEDIAERLRATGIEVELVHRVEGRAVALRECDILVSNVEIPAPTSTGIPTYGGKVISRPTSLRLLKSFGVPTMEWALARTRREVWSLFDSWVTKRVLLKPSFTFGGEGVCVFTRGALWRLRWKCDVDVFCREVNPEDGDVYKAELLNGRLLIAWKSAAPPIRAQFRRGIHRGLRGAYGRRSLWQVPPALASKVETLSRGLTAEGLGHVSVDFMQRPDGELVAIELNPGGVATWWTRQFPHFRENYTNALRELVVRVNAQPVFTRSLRSGDQATGEPEFPSPRR